MRVKRVIKGVIMSLKRDIEAILFLSGEGVKIKELANHFCLSIVEVMNLLNELKEERGNSGINIVFEEGKVCFVTNPICGKEVTNFFDKESKPKKISAAALETVSIIAYKQPITKSEIEAIRGVSVERVLQNLEERKFIKICGKKESIGRPNLYEVTENFLSYLSIQRVDDLPNYKEISGK